MSDMTMVERVARALMLTRGNCDVTDWGEAEWNPAVARAIREARAAINSLDDKPSDAFLALVAERMHDARFSRSGETYPVLRSFLRAVVDAALSEQKP